MTKHVQRAEPLYQDTPANCCGMGLGYAITEAVQHPATTPQEKRWSGPFVWRPPTEQDIEDRLTRLITLTSDNQRNCAIIVLSSTQQQAIDIAKRLGFEVVKEFWNPNSGNQCYILTYTHFDSIDDYNDDWE